MEGLSFGRVQPQRGAQEAADPPQVGLGLGRAEHFAHRRDRGGERTIERFQGDADVGGPHERGSRVIGRLQRRVASRAR
jgi:hypothetical protein